MSRVGALLILKCSNLCICVGASLEFLFATHCNHLYMMLQHVSYVSPLGLNCGEIFWWSKFKSGFLFDLSSISCPSYYRPVP